jgi:hypothetical protein
MCGRRAGSSGFEWLNICLALMYYVRVFQKRYAISVAIKNQFTNLRIITERAPEKRINKKIRVLNIFLISENHILSDQK